MLFPIKTNKWSSTDSLSEMCETIHCVFPNWSKLKKKGNLYYTINTESRRWNVHAQHRIYYDNDMNSLQKRSINISFLSTALFRSLSRWICHHIARYESPVLVSSPAQIKSLLWPAVYFFCTLKPQEIAWFCCQSPRDD